MMLVRKFNFEPIATLMPGHAPLGFHPFANLFPMLTEDRRTQFRDSLAEGQLHAVTLHKGLVLDGRNRYRELCELKKPVSYRVFVGTDREALDFVVVENLDRRDLTDHDRVRIASKISGLRLGDNKFTRQAPPNGGPSLDLGFDPAQPEQAERPPLSAAERASIMHVPLRSVERSDAIDAKGAPELRDAVDKREIPIATAEAIANLPVEEQRQIIAGADPKAVTEIAKKIRKDKNDARRAERIGKLVAQSAGNTDLNTARKFPVIYMDPPTKFAAGDSDRSTENHYPTMDEAQIAALPVGELATDDAVLFIWTTVPWLRKTMTLIEGWGFAYVSELVWDKQTLGLGFWNRNVHETLLIATRGKIPAPDPSTLKPSLYSEARGRHSAKPEYFRDLITAYYPDLPKVELFSRVDGVLPEGWTAWGNEARLQKQQTLGIEGAEEAA
jgi:N6-adenosine-specific RNA methylase IME4